MNYEMSLRRFLQVSLHYLGTYSICNIVSLYNVIGLIGNLILMLIYR